MTVGTQNLHRILWIWQTNTWLVQYNLYKILTYPALKTCTAYCVISDSGSEKALHCPSTLAELEEYSKSTNPLCVPSITSPAKGWVSSYKTEKYESFTVTLKFKWMVKWLEKLSLMVPYMYCIVLCNSLYTMSLHLALLHPWNYHLFRLLPWFVYFLKIFTRYEHG